MLGRAEFLHPRQLVRQLGGLVDEDGQVLRADPIGLALVKDLQQGDLLVVTFAV